MSAKNCGCPSDSVCLLQTTDARVWAQEFIKVKDAGTEIDEALMVGWFAKLWAATYDPLHNEITTLRQQLADMTARAKEEVSRIIDLEKENDGLKKVIADHEITIKICQFNEKNQTSRAIRAEQALEDTK